MVAVIERILTPEQVRSVAERLLSAQFVDGTMSGGPLGETIKRNTQVPPSSPVYKDLAQLVMAAMRANETFNLTAIPRRILSPIFASYTSNMAYGSHVDAALMGPWPGMRTDLSITIFLNGPEAYEGGELVLETPFGEQVFKRPAGDAVLYPTHYVHRVNPVRSGRRLAIVTWIESMVRDPARREIVADLADAMEMLVAAKGDPAVIRKLEKSRLNLLKMWIEP